MKTTDEIRIQNSLGSVCLPINRGLSIVKEQVQQTISSSLAQYDERDLQTELEGRGYQVRKKCLF